ncbi:hypothetical protein FRC05_007701 [Tulasnella sp. 425]|nr:hypothetical protein FRC05_007701 [Tulasnella sp. 425]
MDSSEIGSGKYGEVLLAKLDGSSQTPTSVAVKELRTVGTRGVRRRVALRLARELKIWAKASHPHVLQLVGYYLSDNYEIARLISPFMTNGNVSQYLQKSEVGVVKRLDVANVLMNDGLQAVLCDFGLASFVEESGISSGLTTSRTIGGSIRYMSPELHLEEEAKHTLESDIWAWGCTAFEIVTDCAPYYTVKGDSGIIMAFIRRDPPGSTETLMSRLVDETAADAPPAFQSLPDCLTNCWAFDKKQRPRMPSILRRVFQDTSVEETRLVGSTLERICLRRLKYFNFFPSLTHNFLDNLIGRSRPAPDWVASPRGSGARNHGDRNRVHVRNIPYQAGRQDLEVLFSSAGNIVKADINLPIDIHATSSGTIVFESPEDADRAIQIFNGYYWVGQNLEVRELYVGNLPYQVTPQSLAELFRAAGNVLRVRVNISPYGHAQGSGTVVFGSVREAQTVMQMFNGYKWYERRLEVREHKPQLPGVYSNSTPPISATNVVSPSIGGNKNGSYQQTETPSRQIIVRNLPWSTANVDLVELFDNAGNVELAEVLFDGDRPKDVGIVQFARTEEAETAIAKFQGYMYGGRPMDLAFNDRWHTFTSIATKGWVTFTR